MDILGQFIRNIMAQAVLVGKTFRVQAHDSGQLGNPDQLFSGQIANPGTCSNWQSTWCSQSPVKRIGALNYMRFLFLWTGRTLDWEQGIQFSDRHHNLRFRSHRAASHLCRVSRAPGESDSCQTGKDRRGVALEPFFFFGGQGLARFDVSMFPSFLLSYRRHPPGVGISVDGR
jgi:hypothetical protein